MDLLLYERVKHEILRQEGNRHKARKDLNRVHTEARAEEAPNPHVAVCRETGIGARVTAVAGPKLQSDNRDLLLVRFPIGPITDDRHLSQATIDHLLQ